MSGYRFILIHGTFARNADWTKPASSFCTWLQKALPNSAVSFKEFKWSGWNSHKARWRAALELRSLLTRLDPDDAQTVLICHSYGGMVALLALADFESRSKVSSLICLATPFLAFERRNLSALTWFAAVSITAIVWTIPVLGTLMFSRDVVGAFGSWGNAAIPIILGVLTTCGAFIIVSKALMNRICDMLEGRAHAIQYYLPVIFTEPRITVVHAQHDEARILLTSTTAASNAPYAFCTLIFAVTFVAQLIGGIFATSEWIWHAQNIMQAGLLVAFGLFLSLVLSGLQFIILSPLLLLPTFLRSHPGALGFEGFFTNLLFKIKAASFPVGFTNLSAIVCRRKASWVWSGGIQLNHSMVYQDESVVREIAESLATEHSESSGHAAGI